MPLQDRISNGDTKAVKKPPRPKREFQVSELVYREQIAKLRTQGKEHNDISVLYAVLDMLHKLLPVAEENYQEYPFHTNAAAVNHLTNQIRETLADIRALEDFSKRAELIGDFVGAQFKQLLQSAISDLYSAQKGIAHDPKKLAEEFDKIRLTAAKRFSESEKTVRGRVIQLLHVKT